VKLFHEDNSRLQLTAASADLAGSLGASTSARLSRPSKYAPATSTRIVNLVEPEHVVRRAGRNPRKAIRGKSLAVWQHVNLPRTALHSKRPARSDEPIWLESRAFFTRSKSSRVSTWMTASASVVRRGGGVFKSSSGTSAPMKQ
jgi:hypothetical protein